MILSYIKIFVNYGESMPYKFRQTGERDDLSERRLSMDNGYASYRRFIDGDDDGIACIIRDYKDGLMFTVYAVI